MCRTRRREDLSAHRSMGLRGQGGFLPPAIFARSRVDRAIGPRWRYSPAGRDRTSERDRPSPSNYARGNHSALAHKRQNQPKLRGRCGERLEARGSIIQELEATPRFIGALIRDGARHTWPSREDYASPTLGGRGPRSPILFLTERELVSRAAAISKGPPPLCLGKARAQGGRRRLRFVARASPSASDLIDSESSRPSSRRGVIIISDGRIPEASPLPARGAPGPVASLE